MKKRILLKIIKNVPIYICVLLVLVLANIGLYFLIREVSVHYEDRLEVQHAKKSGVVRREQDYTVTAKDKDGNIYTFDGKKVWYFDGKKFIEF
ncbi:hypothetical protein FACS1894132_03770 [Clostridia bacterium]|nr:hypothetical protein FACS1894132_03770 [Clostridia bacterium]